MKRRSRQIQALQGVIHKAGRTRQRSHTTTGRILAVAGRQAVVEFDGSLTKDKATLSVEAGSGNRCILWRPDEKARWTVLSAWDEQGPPPQTPFGLPSPSGSTSGPLSPPNNLSAMESALDGLCAWVWDAPAQKVVTFEVETAAATGATGVSQLLTRGSYYLEESATPRYLRVRSVDLNLSRSAWSRWIACTPGTAGGGASALNDLTDVTLSSPASGQVLKYNGSQWVNDTDATGGGGSNTAYQMTHNNWLEVVNTTTETSLLDEVSANGSLEFAAGDRDVGAITEYGFWGWAYNFTGSNKTITFRLKVDQNGSISTQRTYTLILEDGKDYEWMLLTHASLVESSGVARDRMMGRLTVWDASNDAIAMDTLIEAPGNDYDPTADTWAWDFTVQLPNASSDLGVGTEASGYVNVR